MLSLYGNRIAAQCLSIKQMRIDFMSLSALFFKHWFHFEETRASGNHYCFSPSSINTIVVERLACAPMTNACSMSAVLLGPLINVPKP